MELNETLELQNAFWRLPPEAYAGRKMVAAALFLQTNTLPVMAVKGGGPRYSRIGRHALYRKADVIGWLEKNGQQVENNSQRAAA